MAHLTGKGGYNLLVDRLNRFPQGAPESESLYDILRIMFSEEEARLVSLLPIKPFTVVKAMKIWKSCSMKLSRKSKKIIKKMTQQMILAMNRIKNRNTVCQLAV